MYNQNCFVSFRFVSFRFISFCFVSVSIPGFYNLPKYIAIPMAYVSYYSYLFIEKVHCIAANVLVLYCYKKKEQVLLCIIPAVQM